MTIVMTKNWKVHKRLTEGQNCLATILCFVLSCISWKVKMHTMKQQVKEGPNVCDQVGFSENVKKETTEI